MRERVIHGCGDRQEIAGKCVEARREFRQGRAWLAGRQFIDNAHGVLDAPL